VRRSRGHGLWIGAWSVVGWVGTGLAPALGHHTFLLMMLSPRALFVAMAANSVPLVPFVVLGTIRLGVTDFSYFALGKRLPLGHANDRFGATRVTSARWRHFVAGLAGRTDRLCRWLATRPGLAGAFLFFRPTGKYLALAGAYGVRGVVAAAASAGGTAVFLIAMHIGFGALL
jgi:hypothetical protein